MDALAASRSQQHLHVTVRHRHCSCSSAALLRITYFPLLHIGLRPFLSSAEATSGAIQWSDEDWEVSSLEVRAFVVALLTEDPWHALMPRRRSWFSSLLRHHSERRVSKEGEYLLACLWCKVYDIVYIILSLEDNESVVRPQQRLT